MKKQNTLISLAVILTSCVFFLSGCQKDESHNYAPPDNTSNSGDINGLLIDAISLKPISRGTVILTDEGGTVVLVQKRTDPNGKFSFVNLKEGIYNIKTQQNGYQEMTTSGISVGELNPNGIFAGFCPVESTTTKPVAGVSGIVLDLNSLPVGGASVSISSDPEHVTNGYFSTVLTDGNGQFYIPAIPLTSTGNTPINSFKIRVKKDTYDPVYETDVILAQNQLTLINFVIEHSSGSETILFEDNFETPTPWVYSGFWHRRAYSPLINSAYPQYVKLAPNDNSGGSAPAAYSGEYYAWYGDETAGNYMGFPASGQASLSGGTSVTSNSGMMISPPIQLVSTTGHATLSFWTWFEVESLNPGLNDHDRMTVRIIDAGDTTQQTTLAWLNPSVDPLLTGRDAFPLTSGGFNQRPLWKFQAFDLTTLMGRTIRLCFQFETVDIYSNGFRGWILDDIKVTGNSMGFVNR